MAQKTMSRSELVEIARAALADESLRQALYATISTEFIIAACEAVVEFANHTCVEVKQETGEVEELYKSVLGLTREMKQGMQALKQVTGTDLVKVFARLENLEVEQERLQEQYRILANSVFTVKAK